MKYHVNPDTGTVAACRAKIKCRFGGASGKENHFEAKADAVVASELILAELNPDTNRLKDPLRKPATADFEATRAQIKSELAKLGVTTKLPEVRTEAEMIAKWFGGDEKKYGVVVRLSSANTTLKAETRSSVSGMVKRGAAVGFVPDIDSISSVKRKGAPEQTQVDILDDDFPKDGFSKEDLAKGFTKR